MNTQIRTYRRHGFTLIELLVVISIIALLMAILMPALGRAREQAKAVVCGAQLHQIGTIFLMYASDNDNELPPSYGSGNWNAFYDFTRDALAMYQVKDGKIFYCPANRMLTDKNNPDPWNTPHAAQGRRSVYYMGYQLFTNVIRADADPLKYSPWALSNGIDTIEPYRPTPVLSWHYSFVHADPELQDIVPARKTTDSSVPVGINGTRYSIKIKADRTPMAFDQTLSRDGVFNEMIGDTAHLNGDKCLGLNAVFIDGHVEWRKGGSLKKLRDYGAYGPWKDLAKWF